MKPICPYTHTYAEWNHSADPQSQDTVKERGGRETCGEWWGRAGLARAATAILD